MLARPQYLLSTVCIGQSLSLSRRATIIGNYKDSIPSHKGSKTLLFFYLFLLFSRGGGSSLSGPRPLIPSRDSRVSRENSLWPRLIANGTKGTSFMGHITDSTKGRMMKRIGGKAEGSFVCSRVPPVQRVFFFFFFQSGRKRKFRRMALRDDEWRINGGECHV